MPKNMAVAPKKPEFSLIDEDLLKSRIYTIRGVKVMLDADLAEIYGYSTGAFNQQVKNNIEKFDDDFRFQITQTEFSGLISKFLISNRGGTRKMPYAFTEQGIYMLMTVLKGDLAIQQRSVKIFSSFYQFHLSALINSISQKLKYLKIGK